MRKERGVRVATAVLGGLLAARVFAAASAETVAWFQKTEQGLMDSVAVGDKGPFDRVLDEGAVITSEEGEVTDRKQLLDSLRGLPPGLKGSIAVRELTVQEFPAFAVVRYLADEKETVFGQELATKYRTTDTFRRDGSAWKLIASHTSVVTADPPAQKVDSSGFARLAGAYKLPPDGWTFTVELRNGELWGGRDPQRMRRMIPLTSDAFVQQGGLGEWIFARDAQGQVTHILDFRKFEPLVWTRVVEKPASKP
jgi:hypothetical protein